MVMDTTENIDPLAEHLTREPLVVSGTIKQIEANFYNFTPCSEIIIEEGVEEIGAWAFCWTNAEIAIIPSSVKLIETNPFPHTDVSSVVCKSPLYYVKDNILVENSSMRLVSFLSVDKELCYTIPPYIKTVGEGSFRGRELKKIIIPETVEKILQNPFVSCKANVINYSPNYIIKEDCLIELATNTLIAYLGNDKKVVVPKGVEIIGLCAFEFKDLEGVYTIELPNSVKEIHDDLVLEYCFGETVDDDSID